MNIEEELNRCGEVRINVADATELHDDVRELANLLRLSFTWSLPHGSFERKRAVKLIKRYGAHRAIPSYNKEEK